MEKIMMIEDNYVGEGKEEKREEVNKVLEEYINFGVAYDAESQIKLEGMTRVIAY